MRFQGHLAAGYVVSRVFINIVGIPPENQLLMTAIGTGAGILPDLDALYYFVRKGAITFDDDFTHHKWITHTFPPYLIVGLLILVVGGNLQNQLIQHSAALLTISTFVHLFLDMIGSGDGIMIAWPFSQRMVGIGKLHVHGMEWKQRYETSVYIWIERLIILVALIILGSNLAGSR
jgi:hypothetical protein